MSETDTLTIGGSRFEIEITPVDDGGYSVTVPSLPGVQAYGDTEKSARNAIAESITAFLRKERGNTSWFRCDC